MNDYESQYGDLTTGELLELLDKLKNHLIEFADREEFQQRVFRDYRKRIIWLENKINFRIRIGSHY